MLTHLFPNFLHDERIYAQAESFWVDLWNRVDGLDRHRNGWRQPWFQPLPPDVGEGNPIFSAVSPVLRRGIRILQSEPTEKGVEYFAYPDTFGGAVFVPGVISEWVISCALSDEAAHYALSQIRQWVAGKPITIDERVGVMPMSRRIADFEVLDPAA